MSHHSLFPFLPCAARRRRGRRRRAADGFSQESLPMFLRSFLVRGVGRRRRDEGCPHEDEEEAAHFLSRHHRCSVDRSSLLLSPLTVSLARRCQDRLLRRSHDSPRLRSHNLSESHIAAPLSHHCLSLHHANLKCTPTLCNHTHAPPTNCLLSDFRPPPLPPCRW